MGNKGAKKGASNELTAKRWFFDSKKKIFSDRRIFDFRNRHAQSQHELFGTRFVFFSVGKFGKTKFSFRFQKFANGTLFVEKKTKSFFVRTTMIIFLYVQGFLRDCPSGRLDKKKFVQVYQQFYPHGKADSFCKFVSTFFLSLF